MYLLLTFVFVVATHASNIQNIQIAVISPLSSDASAGAAAALNLFPTVDLITVESDDSNPYQFASDAQALATSLPSTLVTGFVTVTTSTAAATAVASATYSGKHAQVSVGAFGLNMNLGTSSGLRVTASADQMATAVGGLLQRFGFQKYTVLASSDYAALSTALNDQMLAHFQQEDGGLDAQVGAATSYIFRSGNSSSTKSEVLSVLTRMKKSISRVVVLMCSKEDARIILQCAQQADMLKKGWLWTGIGWLDNEFLASDVVPKSALIGTLGLVPAPFSTTGDKSSLYYYTHDAVFALATSAVAVSAANPTLNPSKDMEFCKLVQEYALTHEFSGLTGPITFDHDQDVDDVAGDPYNDRGSRISPPFAVLNVQSSLELREVLLLSGENGQVLGVSNVSGITWPGGYVSSLPPSDRTFLELGAQSWYIVIALLFVGLGFLLAGEGERRGCQSLFQESLVIVTVGVIAGLLLRAVNDEELMETAIFDETVFTFVLLPIIIFDSGFGMENKNLFFRNLGSILLLAIPGTLCVALFIGGLLLVASNNGALALSGAECFATGALLSAIDPVATIGVFGSLGVPKRLSVLVTGEAVINDAVAIVLYRTMVGFMGEIQPTGEALVGAFFLTLLNLIGSAVVGSCVMMVGALALKCLRLPSSTENEHAHRHSAEIQVLILLLFSYLAFALCEGMTLSGIVASLSGGLTASLYCAGNMDAKGKDLSKRMFKVLATMSEALIFFNVGLNIALFLVTNRAQLNEVGVFLPVIAIVLCSVSRLVILPPFVACLNCRRQENRITWQEQAIMWHAGLRGAIAWALAIKFPSQNRDAIVAATTSVILFTTYVQGGTTTCCLKCMKIPTGSLEPTDEVSGTGSSSRRGHSTSGSSTSIRRARSTSNRDRTLPRWMRSIKLFHETTMRPLLTTNMEDEGSHERLSEEKAVDPVDVAMASANI